jgi:hypothetical protein
MSMKIDASTLNVMTVDRAIELDVECNESLLLESIADLIQAVRDGASHEELARHACCVATEYESITECAEFELDPMGELVGALQSSELEKTPVAQMARA